MIWPPNRPDYFNLCYHYTELGEIAGFLKNQLDNIDVFDGGVMDKGWDELDKQLSKNYEIIIVLNNFETIENLRKVLEICKKKLPKAKIITYGQVSSLIPNFFKRYPLDAIINSGNWEIGIKKYIAFLKRKSEYRNLTDILIKQGTSWIETKKGKLLQASGWGFPYLEKLPLDKYAEIYRKNKNIAGIENKKELALTITRGCPFNCLFCIIPDIQGTKDRRRDENSVLDFIEASMNRFNFDYVSFFSPSFTLDKEYVVRFCKEIRNRKMNFKWKCVTHVNCIDNQLIKVMAESGCFRIGFGIETLEKSVQNNIKKHIEEKQVEKAIKLCIKNNIEPLCFVMKGIPGQTKSGLEYTIEKIKSLGGKVRTSVYVPFQEINDYMSEEEIVMFNKKPKFC